MNSSTSIALVATLLTAGCQVADPAKFDAVILAELEALAAVLAEPHSVPTGEARHVGRAVTDHPIDFGCAMPEDFMPDVHWVRVGLSTSSSDPTSFDPEDRLAERADAVTRACWRVQRLGCPGLFRESLERIARNPTLGSAPRCQAVRALGSIGDIGAASSLLAVVDDDTVGPESIRALARIRSCALAALRKDGFPDRGLARERVTWLLGRAADDLDTRELEWLADGLSGPSAFASAWTLVRACDSNAHEVVRIALPLLIAETPSPAACALFARARLRDEEVEAAALAIAAGGEGAARELSLQYLGIVQHPAALDLLSQIALDASESIGARAAATLGLQSLRGGNDDRLAALGLLINDSDVRIVRAALTVLTSASVLPAPLSEQVANLRKSDDRDVRFLAWCVGR